MIYPFASQIIPIQGVASSMQGGRPENQDDWGFYETPLGCLLIVCDGMGGGPGGKTASYIVKTVIASTLQDCSPQTSRIDALKRAVSMANDALYQKMDETPSLRGMGSTMVAVLINAHSAVIAHLGDSRCYRISNGHVVHRTDDHSLVGELVRNKALTEEQARTSPQSNVIMRGLGNTSNHVAEIAEVPYCKNDRFILCTDGVWGIMPHEQLVQRLTSQQTIDALASNLSAEVDHIGNSTGGHHDNHTLAIIEMKTNSILKDKMNRIAKITIAVLAALLVVSLVFNITSSARQRSLTKSVSELEEKIQQLQSDMALYQSVKDADTKKLLTSGVILQTERDSLLKMQDILNFKIDSLQKVVAELQEKSGRATQAKQQTAKQTATPQELAQRILNLLANMENAKGATSQETVKKLAETRNKIIELLSMLDKQTGGKYASKIASINRELKSPNPQTDKAWVNPKNNKEYVSTKNAKKIIQQISGKVKDIKKQL